jgi:hypothetical protein
MINGKAALLKAVDYERGDFWVILDDQDAHGREHRERGESWEFKTRSSTFEFRD